MVIVPLDSEPRIALARASSHLPKAEYPQNILKLHTLIFLARLNKTTTFVRTANRREINTV
jgi:hypothetical protein